MSDPATVLLLERLLAEVQGLRAAIEARPAAPVAASEPEGLLDVKGAGRLLGMSPSWVYQRSEAGELPCVRLGGARRFDPAELRAYARGELPSPGRLLPIRKRGV